MITKDKIKKLLVVMGFISSDDIVYTKTYAGSETTLKVNVRDEHIFYDEAGIVVGRLTTSNFSEPENFVVLECVNRLLSQGYQARHIELEPKWKLGHGSKGGYADIWVRTLKDGVLLDMDSDSDKESLLIIECKKSDEFNGAWNDTLEDGAQLFSYFQQEKATKFLCLYTSDLFDDGTITPDYYLVNVQDNTKMLENEEDALTYEKATNNKQLYKVWHETYHCEYAKVGLFERDVQAYQIGKNKYNIHDLIKVNNETIKKKYSEFANILRQHNVGAHENAFDKLVNLFLAKVVDETNNPDDLHFYWKGAAYDDDFQLQDRLQRLYRDGMKKFLGEDVTYVEDKEIDKAFRRFKNDPDETRKTIKEYFRALKFFSDNDFSFISVHNKKLFQQNAAILRKVILMLQDICLKDSDTHQFLGDLFEGFLTKGVKQSEGQFFTPMPIVRFIVTSLPLENLISESQDIPWVIDYACGAGHFLTEYADRIKEYVEKYRPDIPMKDYYSRITGIEKEYRLSKVSKVSAFMYGHDETHIIYSDALQAHPDVENDRYKVLIANPPYAVSGFLETLDEKTRKSYQLFNEDINLAKNNAIETFFIERAAQLMQADGVAGIILPVSVLNKGGIYTRAREIILKNFHIVSLVELGSGTFGKTGTNTVVMFLRRKETNNPDSEHYINRVHSWFNQSTDADEIYQDTELLDTYCQHLGYAVDDYIEFLQGTMTESFLASEVIQTYKSSFFGTQRNAMKDVCEDAKNIRAKYTSRSKTATFRTLSAEDKQKETDKAFYNFVKAIEQEKLYIFILALQTETPVLLVKSPLPKKGETNEKIKTFLGYDWSESKGNEGIHYLHVKSGASESSDEGNEEDDDTMLQQIDGIKGIVTPLFDPADFENTAKINYLIRQNFLSNEFDIPKDLDSSVSSSNLVQLIDFRLTSFNKQLKTTINVEVEYQSKYPSVKLNDMCDEILAGGDRPNIFSKELTTLCNVPVYSNGVSNQGLFGYTNTPTITQPCVTVSARGTLGYCVYHDSPFVPIVRLIVCIPNSQYQAKYIKHVLECIEFVNEGATTPQLSVPKIRQYKLPDAPIDIQNLIIQECDVEDVQIEKLDNEVVILQSELSQLFSSAQSLATNELRLNNEDIFDLSIGRRVLKSEIKKDGDYDVFSANVFEPFGKINSSILTDFSTSSVLWGIDGDWMVNYIPENHPFHPTDHCGVIKVKDESVVLAKYLVYPLLKVGEHERFSRANRASTERIKALTIKVPDITIQKATVEKVFELENRISELKNEMAACQTRKQTILDKYLK